MKAEKQKITWANKEEIISPSRLTDNECDFIIQRILWKLRDATSPVEFFRAMGRGPVFEVTEENREQVRDLVRLFVRGEAAK